MADDYTRKRSSAWTRAYPFALEKCERELLAKRRNEHGVGESESPPAESESSAHVGLALSGGGIRSATFGFGVIQALAELEEPGKSRMLGEIDVLSTVSGGGYVGSLISRLYARTEVQCADDVARAILPGYQSDDPTVDGDSKTSGDESGNRHDDRPNTLKPGAVLRWLRANGRYLAPNGSGDLLLGGAVILRNWISIHIVLATLALTVFVAMQCVRDGLYHLLSGSDCTDKIPACISGRTQDGFCWLADLEAWFTCHLPLGETFLWWSPWLLLPALLFIVAVVPFGWAYWIVTDDGVHWKASQRPLSTIDPIWVLFGITEAAFLVSAYHGDVSVPAAAILLAGSVTYIVTIFIIARRSVKNINDSTARSRLSACLKVSLVLFGVSLGLAVIDTLGQTVYAIWASPDLRLGWWLGPLLIGLITAVAGARRIAAFFSGKGSGRVRLPLDITSMLVAVMLFIVTLTTVNAFSHGIAWGFEYPRHVPEKLVASSATQDATITSENVCVSNDSPCPDSSRLMRLACTDCAELGERDISRTATFLMVLVVLSWLFGRSWAFLNNSTLLPLYTARLTRAYLGASNPARISPQPDRNGANAPVAVTQVHQEDDLPIQEHWWNRNGESDGQKKDDPFTKGAPLHLVNVTINRTVGGKSGLQHNDHRGISMAIGPAGISAGIRHHVVFRNPEQDMADTIVFPEETTEEADQVPFRMFDYAEATNDQRAENNQGKVRYTGRHLSLGQWIGISGAAFSTGLGSRTSLGLSLLAGFFNIRLGLWWDSGVEPTKRARAVTRSLAGCGCGRLFSWLLPVQGYLLDEILSRFHGVARRWWYLSDGGHFENTGAYELIRRRLPLIVIVDAGADPDYTYEDIANLVRKARTDFCAEIRFLGPDALGKLRRRFNQGNLAHFGSLDMLRRGSWSDDPFPGAEGNIPPKRLIFRVSDRTRRSVANASIAVVYYGNEPTPRSLIVHIKPALVGNEPPDITHYHAAHPDFPQQTTSDQFFDEAQWESYRKLGHFIAKRIFTGGFAPYLAMRKEWPWTREHRIE